MKERAQGGGRDRGRAEIKKGTRTTTTVPTTTAMKRDPPPRTAQGGPCETPSALQEDPQHEKPPLPRKRKFGGTSNKDQEKLLETVVRLAARGGYNDIVHNDNVHN